MKLYPNTKHIVTLVVSVGLFIGCDPPPLPPSDGSPPEFLEVKIELVDPAQPNLNKGTFDIKSADVTKDKIPSNLEIKVTATAGDAESSISNITIASQLRWKCSFGRSEVIGVLQDQPLNFSPPLATPPPPANRANPWQISATAKPVAQAGCATDKPGAGSVNLSGFVRVTATNGLGTTVTSKTFIYDYADVGAISFP